MIRDDWVELQKGTGAREVAAQILGFLILALTAGCAGNGSGATDLGDFGSSDTDTGIHRDGAVSDIVLPDDLVFDAGSEIVDPLDLQTDEDSVDGGIDVSSFCGAPDNVIVNGLALEVEIDLANYLAREYTVKQRITVEPESPGESISLYGASLLLGSVNVPYRYNGNLVTFCTGSFAAGEAVTVEAQFVISEAYQAFPPGALAGMRIWGPTSGDFAIGPFSSPFFASTWLLVPQTQSWFSKEHDGNVIVERFDLRVIVPDDGWVVIGPGAAQIEDNAWQFLIEQDVPLYTLSFAASPSYELVPATTTDDGVELLAGVTATSKEHLLMNLEAGAAAINWMSDQMGPYSWGDTLAFAEIPGFSGGMEHTGAIWMGSAVMDGGATGDYVAVHEAVHHWWGNHVQIADWPHFWLSEGMTDWTTVFTILETVGDPEAVKGHQLKYRQNAATSSYPANAGAPLPGPLRFSDDGEMMTQVSNNLLFFYYYGASFLEMVDQRLRRDFDTDLVPILQLWYLDFGGTQATTEDFLALLSEETGAPETWEQLFAEWVYTGPAPTLEFRDYSFADGETSLTIARTGGADQNLAGLEVIFVHGNALVVESVSLPPGVDVVTVHSATAQPPDRIIVDPLGFYILRLETESNFAGPDVDSI